MAGDVFWNSVVERNIVLMAPMRAHRFASAGAAGAAARMIRSKRSGNLARDLSLPTPRGALVSEVGSRLRYARIEAVGGRIAPVNAPYMVIPDVRHGATGQATRSDFGGRIMATVGPGRGKGYVMHRGKGWHTAALAAYRRLFMPALRREMPKGRM